MVMMSGTAGEARGQAEKQQATADEFRRGGEACLERGRRQAELGEVVRDLLEVVQLSPARLEEHQPDREAGDGG
jgi:hypothetical protein